jgi:3-methyl-2-oxobutanoate hydroxymethyltransferase
MGKKKSVLDFWKMKEYGEKITFLTCDDYHTAIFAEKAGLDMLLVGDSLGMVVYGYENTRPVTMGQMIVHTEAVRRGAPNTFVIGDMPFMSYQESVDEAIHNAGRFYREANVDAIKLEGGRRVINQIKGIVDAGMVVMGHIGLTLQSSGQLGQFKAHGRTAKSAMELILDAKAIEEAGAFAILLEAVTPEVAKIITERTQIPILGIGSGIDCDGQVLIVGDMLGLSQAFTREFEKKYALLGDNITEAFSEYIKDVKEKKFPEEKHAYRMEPGEKEKLEKML